MIYSNSIMQDVVSVSLESTQNRVFTVTIDCIDGHELSLGTAIADLAVEAKHSAAGAYTDIETTAIDLSTWAGTTQTFYIKLTAGTITSHLIRSFRLYVGPTMAAEYGQLTFNSVPVRFSRRIVTFAPDEVSFNGEPVTFRSSSLKFNP